MPEVTATSGEMTARTKFSVFANGVSLLLPTNAAGFAAQLLPIPSHTSFVGLDLVVQATAPDPTAPAGFTLSAGLGLTLGR